MRALLPIVFLILAGVTFFYFTDPVLSEIKSLRATEKELNRGLEKAGELADRQRELTLRKNAIAEEQLDRLNKLIPDHIDNVRLIIEMGRVGARAGMPLRDLSVEIDDQSSDVSSELSGSKNTLNRASISFKVSGSYDLFKSFMANLADNLRILDVKGFSLSAEESGVYNYSVQLQTYWLNI